MSLDPLLLAFKDRLKDAAFPCLIRIAGSNEEVLSASSLWISALNKRHQMRAQGMRPGDLWLQTEGGLDGWINFFACLLGGFLFCPKIMPSFETADSVRHRAFFSEQTAGLILHRDIHLSKTLLGEPGFAVLLHTSGTSTGQPRTIRLESSMILHQLDTHSQILGIEAESNRLLILPWFHSFGLILDGLLGLYSRQYLYCLPEMPMHPRRLMDALQLLHIDWLAAVPRTLQLLQTYIESHPQYASQLRSLKIHSGGAFMAQEQRLHFGKIFASFWWGYGLTECGPGVLLNGRPVGCEVKAMPSLVDGSTELWVRSPSLGHWQGREQELKDSWYPSGDLVRVAADNEYEVLGRKHDSFKTSSGLWIHLRELERNMEQSFKLAGVHISLQENGSFFLLRILLLAQNRQAEPDLKTRILHKLSHILPLPIKIFASRADPEVWDALAIIPQKSLNEALGWLPHNHFVRLE